MTGAKIRTVSRRGLIAGTCSLWLARRALAGAEPAGETGDAPVIRIGAGRLRGQTTEGVNIFRGIPYAAPAGGANRFAPPAKLAAWEGVRDALRYGPRAMQDSPAPGPVTPIPGELGATGEDCLNLSVWSAGLNDKRRRPVMVWLHGGGFAHGSGNDLRCDGSALALRHGVVVVTVNYRLGPFGCLALGDCRNPGLLDLVAALEWVRDTIAVFGGDAARVTIFGGEPVSALLAMPAARGLFHRAIIQSDTMLRAMEPDEAARTTAAFLAALGLPAGTTDLAALRVLPAERLLAAARQAGPFGPVVDGQVLPCHPFDPTAPTISADVPLIVGSDEAGDASLAAVRKAALGRAPAYLYRFAKTTNVTGGTPPGLDIPYAFDNLDLARELVGIGTAQQALADRMSGAWARFAATGNPNGGGLPQWPAFSATARNMMVLDDVCRLTEAEPS